MRWLASDWPVVTAEGQELTRPAVLLLLQQAVMLRELSDAAGRPVAQRGGVRQPGGLQVAAGVGGRGGGVLLELGAARRLQAPPALVVGVFGVVAAVLHAVGAHDGAVEHCGRAGGRRAVSRGPSAATWWRKWAGPLTCGPHVAVGQGSARHVHADAHLLPLGQRPLRREAAGHVWGHDGLVCRDAQRTTHNTQELC